MRFKRHLGYSGEIKWDREIWGFVEADEGDLELLKRCAEWAVRYCHITRSLGGGHTIEDGFEGEAGSVSFSL